ncbi:hypothetical protein [Telmatospirillum sp. J64-1]|uniref:hypothetical protein n=1 Tax=Telmatospirillum sp. J64-1 TaxID=2502183 RepID=UPI00163D9B91|nr:hypothetical protein [Telmatospirillum sp. J64-1]
MTKPSSQLQQLMPRRHHMPAFAEPVAEILQSSNSIAAYPLSAVPRGQGAKALLARKAMGA